MLLLVEVLEVTSYFEPYYLTVLGVPVVVPNTNVSGADDDVEVSGVTLHVALVRPFLAITVNPTYFFVAYNVAVIVT